MLFSSKVLQGARERSVCSGSARWSPPPSQKSACQSRNPPLCPHTQATYTSSSSSLTSLWYDISSLAHILFQLRPGLCKTFPQLSSCCSLPPVHLLHCWPATIIAKHQWQHFPSGGNVCFVSQHHWARFPNCLSCSWWACDAGLPHVTPSSLTGSGMLCQAQLE